MQRFCKVALIIIRDGFLIAIAIFALLTLIHFIGTVISVEPDGHPGDMMKYFHDTILKVVDMFGFLVRKLGGEPMAVIYEELWLIVINTFRLHVHKPSSVSPTEEQHNALVELTDQSCLDGGHAISQVHTSNITCSCPQNRHVLACPFRLQANHRADPN